MRRTGSWTRYFLVVIFTVGLTTAVAHPHVVSGAHQGSGQQIAHGQNHGPYVNGEVCDGDPAAYGLEAAHHGPDSGDPGKADGCYRIDGTVPALDDQNPAID